MSDALDVLLGETRVGLLERFEDESQRFTFDAEWLDDPVRPVLGQLFEDRRPTEIIVGGPLCWFAHLLPQGPLRRAIARLHNVEEGDVFDLIRVLGDDLPGAVVVRPAAQTAGAALSTAPGAPCAPGHPGVRMSALAGQQWKLSVRPGERGLVLPLAGETGSWIAKFHDPRYPFPPLPRIEHATMQWAKLSGLPAPPFRLGRVEEIIDIPPGIPTGDGDVYLIERFDRAPGDLRLHMEDMGQVLDRPPGDSQFHGSYEEIAAVLAALAPQDIRDFCERLVFCVLCGNTDAHLKNWSLLYPDTRTPRLSPVYDIVASVLYAPALDDGLALDLAGSRRFEDVTEASFDRLARAARVAVAELRAWVGEAARRVRDVWRLHGGDLSFTAAERVRLDAHLARVPLGS